MSLFETMIYCHTSSLHASITAIQRLNREILEKQAYHGMDSFDPKTANIRYQFLPSLYIESSAVKMGLMCINNQNIMFMTGWIHCPQIFNTKSAIQSFIIQHGVELARGVSSLYFDKGHEYCSMEICTLFPACSRWDIWHLYLEAPPFYCTRSG